MKYSELGLKTNLEEKKVKLDNGATIFVKQYLPISDKLSLIEIALQNSLHADGYYDPMVLDFMFNTYVVFCYTDIEFTDEEKGEIGKLYDELLSTGVMKKILDAIPQSEYDELFGYLEEKRAAAVQYKGSLADAVQTFMNDLPRNAEAAQQIVDSFDKTKYAEVIDFAKAANGGKLPE